MKLKRFVAKDMREALTMVKDELGADAIIMSNKRVATGVEIVAGVERLPNPAIAAAPAPGGAANTMSLQANVPPEQMMLGGNMMLNGAVAGAGYGYGTGAGAGMAMGAGAGAGAGMAMGAGAGAGAGMGMGAGAGTAAGAMVPAGYTGALGANAPLMPNAQMPMGTVTDSPAMGSLAGSNASPGGSGHQIGSALANLANAIALSGQQQVLSNEGITINNPNLAASLESQGALRPNLQPMGVNGTQGAQAPAPLLAPRQGAMAPAPAPAPALAGQAPLNAQGTESTDPAARQSASGKHQAYAQSLIEILERQNTMSKEQGDRLMVDIAAQQNAKLARDSQKAFGTFSADMPVQGGMANSSLSAANAAPKPQVPAAPVASKIAAAPMAPTGDNGPVRAEPRPSSSSDAAAVAAAVNSAVAANPALGGMRNIDEDSLKGTGVSRIINPTDGEDEDMANDPMKKAGPSRIDPSLDEDADLFKTPPLPLSQQREFKNFFGKSKARQEKEDYESRAGIETYRQGSADAAVVRQDLEKMRAEVENIRKLLQFELAGLLQDNRSRNEPVKAMIYKLLHSVGFSDKVADLLVNHLPAEISFNSAWREIVKLLERTILVGDDEIISQGGIVTLIGPAGVGKTTTLAKLAARFVMRYGPQRIAIITADHYRIGAVEQIKTYGRIMGCATFAVKNLSELPQLLYTLSDKSLILVDTAGVGFKDERFNTQLSQLKLQASLKLKHYLVLPCTTQRKVLQHAYDHFAVVGLTGLILTKIDECQNLGDALSLCIEMKLPISYITDGQRVPEDLDVPNPQSLAHRALSAIEDDAAQRSLASTRD